jgi:hypothetical protein
MEAGTSSFMHEMLHHLGMQHTFADGSCTDADQPTGVCESRARAPSRQGCAVLPCRRL